MEMRVALDKLGAYSPGETLRGRVIVAKSGVTLLPKAFGLSVRFDGKCLVKFKTQAVSETYFHETRRLVGDGTSEVPVLSGAGVAEFPFTYTLPPFLPSSYKGTHGVVDYTITATLQRSWGGDKEVLHPFNVQAELDVGALHHQRRETPITSMHKSGRVGMLWWNKGTVFVHFSLRKKAYIPGECLQFSAQIINDSNSKFHKAKLLLTQEVRFQTQESAYVVTHIVKKVKGPAVKGGERAVSWEDPTILKVPPLIPPTDLGGYCTFIQLNYFVHPSTMTWKDRTVVCKLPITIGTRRAVASRDSWCYGEGNSSSRVASIFRSAHTTLDRGCTLSPTPTMSGESNYYQNVVFPLNRCFSAPLYENHRFGPTISPFTLLEEGAEPPPTYEEAMEWDYQNSAVMMMTPPPRGPLLQSSCASPVQQPLYNN